jgi:hypothetical protein
MVGGSRQSWQASGDGWVTLAPCLRSLVGGRSTRCLAARSSGGKRLWGEADGADLGEEKRRITGREAPWERERELCSHGDFDHKVQSVPLLGGHGAEVMG